MCPSSRVTYQQAVEKTPAMWLVTPAQPHSINLTVPFISSANCCVTGCINDSRIFLNTARLAAMTATITNLVLDCINDRLVYVDSFYDS